MKIIFYLSCALSVLLLVVYITFSLCVMNFLTHARMKFSIRFTESFVILRCSKQILQDFSFYCHRNLIEGSTPPTPNTPTTHASDQEKYFKDIFVTF